MKIEEEFDSYDKTSAWHAVYHKIRQDSVLQHNYSLKDAKKPEFKGRNRYRDVSPYDHSRVCLKKDDIDYINASLVDYPAANRSYILTQGPLPDTVGHFWVLVWEQNSAAILMLNRLTEMGRVKCHQYFPMGCVNEDEDEMVFKDVNLKVSYISEENANFFIIRTLEIEDLETCETKRVLQFHYTTWPDFGVPESPGAFLNFLFAVRQAGVLDQTVGPPVIHCSAGIGRSGTFCLVDTCLVLIERKQDPNCVDVCDILMEMRQYRMGLIQTADQLRFSYMAIIEGCKLLLNNNPCTDSGIDDNQLCQSSSSGSSSLPTDAQMSEDNDDLLDSLPSTPPPIPPRTVPPPNQHTNSDNISNTTNSLDNITNNNPSHVTSGDHVTYTDHITSTKLHNPGHEGSPRASNALSQNKPHDVVQNSSHTSLLGNGSAELRDDVAEMEEPENETIDPDMLRMRQDSQEIRRRNREDRKKNTSAQIATMKQKQQECERYKIRQQGMRPYLWGISAAVVLGSYMFYKYYIT